MIAVKNQKWADYKHDSQPIFTKKTTTKKTIPLI